MPSIQDERHKLVTLKQLLEREETMSEIGVVAITGAQINADGTSWIEVMPTAEKVRNGEWYFSVTAEDLGTLASYIQENPDRIPVDYDHATSEKGDSRAAGWFTGEAMVVQAGEEGPTGEQQDRPSAWARVKWTPGAVQEIRDGVFRFISPEWHFTQKDAKTGLMTQLRDIVAATLTNRPFFKNLSPVTAKELADSEQIDAITAEHGEDVAELVLRSLEREETQETAQKLLAAVWTTAYINDLPDSSFLYIEGGGEKDSEGKTTPRSLRHFPVKDASGSPDLAHIRNALARIPQSNVPAEAKASATAKCQRMLRDAGGNPSATDQGANDETKETTVADEQPQVTDYMKMLGLDETVDPKHRLAAAFREKDEKILALEQKVTELAAAGGAKEKEATELAERLEALEQRDRERDIEVILTRAVDRGRVLPAEKEVLSDLFAKDVNGLKRLVATRPENFAGAELTPKGVSGDASRFVDEPDVQQLVRDSGYTEPVDTESAKVHLTAMQILKDQGKANDYTDDEYVAACDQAAKSLAY